MFGKKSEHLVLVSSNEQPRSRTEPLLTSIARPRVKVVRPQAIEESILKIAWSSFHIEPKGSLEELIARRSDPTASLLKGSLVYYQIQELGQMRMDWPLVNIAPHTLMFMAEVVAASGMLREVEQFPSHFDRAAKSPVFSDVIARLEYAEGYTPLPADEEQELEELIAVAQENLHVFSHAEVNSWLLAVAKEAQTSPDLPFVATADLALKVLEQRLRDGSIRTKNSKTRAQLIWSARRIYQALTLPRMRADVINAMGPDENQMKELHERFRRLFVTGEIGTEDDRAWLREVADIYHSQTGEALTAKALEGSEFYLALRTEALEREFAAVKQGSRQNDLMVRHQKRMEVLGYTELAASWARRRGSRPL